MKHINEEFDPYNLKHIKEWEYLSKHGNWEEGSEFLSMKCSPQWQIEIMSKMTKALVFLMLNGKVEGVP